MLEKKHPNNFSEMMGTDITFYVDFSTTNRFSCTGIHKLISKKKSKILTGDSSQIFRYNCNFNFSNLSTIFFFKKLLSEGMLTSFLAKKLILTSILSEQITFKSGERMDRRHRPRIAFQMCDA